MRRYPRKLQTLLQIARREAHRRAPVPAGEPDAAEIRRLAQQALRATTRPGASREGHPPERPSWAVAFERLCWWGAGATVALCLLVGVLQRPPPEPEVFELLLEWPAANGGSDPDVF